MAYDTLHPACQGLNLVPSPNLAEDRQEKTSGLCLQFFPPFYLLLHGREAHRYQEDVGGRQRDSVFLTGSQGGYRKQGKEQWIKGQAWFESHLCFLQAV